jgi:hypothetical protein
MIKRYQPLMRLLILGTALLMSPGIQAQVTSTAGIDGTSPVHCYHAPRSRSTTCTPCPISTLHADAEAKRLTPQAGLLTVYVVRQRWSDVRHVIDLLAGEHRVGTVPDSFVRLRLAPGEHRIAFDWQGWRMHLAVSGQAGEVRVVELAGSIWAWGARYEWVTDDEAGARVRLQRCRLVADLG